MKNILKNFPSLQNDKIILAVSGGIDSMVLFDIIQKNIPPENIIVAHCNHGYRKESDEEAQFVKNICFQKKIIFEEEKAISLKNNEVDARNFRYNFFYNLMKKYNAKAILTAHHKNDQVETVLFRLMRGAGLAGLAGMKGYDKSRKIIRPLLKCTKNEIKQYALNNKLEWREDSTNQETNYDRCWIRNQIIPSIEERKPGFCDVLYKTSQNLSEISSFMEEEAHKWLIHQSQKNYTKKQVEAKVFMNQTDFLNLHIALQKEIVIQLYIQYNDSRQKLKDTHIQNTLKWIKGMKPGSELPFGKIKLRNYGNYIAVK